jgi:hypothetical protein
MIVLVIEKDATKTEKSSVPYGRTNVSGILDATWILGQIAI